MYVGIQQKTEQTNNALAGTGHDILTDAEGFALYGHFKQNLSGLDSTNVEKSALVNAKRKFNALGTGTQISLFPGKCSLDGLPQAPAAVSLSISNVSRSALPSHAQKTLPRRQYRPSYASYNRG